MHPAGFGLRMARTAPGLEFSDLGLKGFGFGCQLRVARAWSVASLEEPGRASPRSSWTQGVGDDVDVGVYIEIAARWAAKD